MINEGHDIKSIYENLIKPEHLEVVLRYYNGDKYAITSPSEKASLYRAYEIFLTRLFDLPYQSTFVDGLLKDINEMLSYLSIIDVNGIRIHGIQIVVGDHGPYYTWNTNEVTSELTVPDHAKWRFNPKYTNIKYHEYDLKGHKVYHQISTVTYAPYLPGHYYLSCYYPDITVMKLLV